MKTRFGLAVVLGMILILGIRSPLHADDGYDLWLKYGRIENDAVRRDFHGRISRIVIPGQSETLDAVRRELRRGFQGLFGEDVPVATGGIAEGTLLVGTPSESVVIKKLKLDKALDTLGRDGFLIRSIPVKKGRALVIAANEDIGLLYGAFHLLRLIQAGEALEAVSKPRIQYRLINHWDNPDGSVERGYAGKSLWKWDQLPDSIDARYLDYARANASIGINGAVLNNVNAKPEILREDYLVKAAKLADIFRPYGIRVFLSINFSSPLSPSKLVGRRGGIGNLSTSDPLDPAVRQWWKDKSKEIYRAIPDFGGFLVKANSEGMPGPQDYGRTHADGANMLAEALEPFGGIVMWRAFVYNAETDEDRAKRAFKEFVPLDGKFRSNVFVQAKNGPIDFQPREPVQPLFGAMPQTSLMLELQVTQEYLGHSKHLVYLAPMWKEYFDFDTDAAGLGSTLGRIVDGSLQHDRMTGIAGVANTGDDRNWCGHFFGQANWYAFGRIAWDHQLSTERIAEEWIEQSLTRDPAAVASIQAMMHGTWEACVNYMTPLGLHHIMQEGFHYGPEPDFANAPRLDWASVYYHRADNIGLGYDRSSTGSGATGQYFQPLCDSLDAVQTCPEKYLLWFHHVPWSWPMASGRTLWDELCYRYDSGLRYVDEMMQTWSGLEGRIDPEIFNHVQEKLAVQRRDAGIWRDTCVKYFQRFSGMQVPKEGE